MSLVAVEDIIQEVIGCIAEIDQECCTMVNGIEHGLINVKREFRDRAQKELRKKLTEETLITWLLWKKLRARGWATESDIRYPGNKGKRADLVVMVRPDRKLWLELKLAWKAWFNCKGDPDYYNRYYLPYLQGEKRRTHSFKDDFKKLTAQDEAWPVEEYRGVCLIGFDWCQKPMDGEVMNVVRDVQPAGQPWQLVAEKHWADRRNSAFRINVWCWVFCSEQVTTLAEGAAREG